MGIVPPFLLKGDLVALIAPARKVTDTEVSQFIEFINKQEWECVLGKNLFAQHFQFAGTDEQRCTDLQWALDHPKIKAIFMARGGYGTARLLDFLNWAEFKKYPKWICGYSDITALHCESYSKTTTASIHSPHAYDFDTNNIAKMAAFNSLVGILQGKPYQLVAEMQHLSPKKCTLWGGNLSVIYSLMGSSSVSNISPNTVLFLEDVDEHLYHIDRMMLALHRAQFLKKFKGIVLGQFSSMHNKDLQNPFGKSAFQIIEYFAHLNDIEVWDILPSGHIEANMPFILGNNCKFEANFLHGSEI